MSNRNSPHPPYYDTYAYSYQAPIEQSEKPGMAQDPEKESLKDLVADFFLHFLDVEKRRASGDFRHNNEDNIALLIHCYRSGLLADTEEEQQTHDLLSTKLGQLFEERQLQTQVLREQILIEQQLEKTRREKIKFEMMWLEGKLKNRDTNDLSIPYQRTRAMDKEMCQRVLELAKMTTFRPVIKDVMKSIFKW